MAALADPLKRLEASQEHGASYATHPLLTIADRVLCEALTKAISGVQLRVVPGYPVPWSTSTEELARR